MSDLAEGYTTMSGGWDQRQDFLRLWRLFLEDELASGPALEASDDNLREYLRVYDSYIMGSLFGSAIFGLSPEGEVVGVALGGENFPGGLNIQTKWGRTGTMWGVYVEPEHRRSGLSWAMLEHGGAELAKMGIVALTTVVMDVNTVGIAHAFNFRAVEEIGRSLICYTGGQLPETST